MLKAESNIVHPFRLLVAGKAKSGKTTLVVDIIHRIMRPQIDRIIVLCPSWNTQDVFDPIRDMVNPSRDVWTDLDTNPFATIMKQLLKQIEYAKAKGTAPIRTLLFIDDMSGSKMMHSGRITPLSHLSIQSRHLCLSIFILSQQPKSITPGFRDNTDGVIAFPPQRELDRAWLYQEYNGNAIEKQKFIDLIMTAWKGVDRKDFLEFGTHFLFILLPFRSITRYFADFDYELTITK